MIIKNVKVFTEDKAFIDGQIAIQDGVCNWLAGDG